MLSPCNGLPMHWIQLRFATDKNQAEALESALLQRGALAITLSDAHDQPLFEPLPGETPLWERVELAGLFDAAIDSAAIIDSLQSQYGPLPPYKIEILEDKDWVKTWMDQYEPIQFGERLWICPTWHQPPDPNAANIMLDPGLAFGTGTHATTALCLNWLAATPVTGKALLDYGCGSGILGIGALLLGCRKVYAIDIDPQALQATESNAQCNGLTQEQIEIGLPHQLKPPAVDLVIANILAGPLTQLAPALAELTKAGGQIALSGILNSQTEQVKQAYEPWFEFAAPVEKEGWMLLSARKRD